MSIQQPITNAWTETVDIYPDDETADGTLVTLVLNGSQGAFEILVRRHQAALFRRARWMGLDSDTAADMVQDSFINAYKNLSSCREPDRFGFWIGKILRNRCLDFLKSALARNVPLPPFLPATDGNPEIEEHRSKLRDQLTAALAMLPDEQREAFLMKHAEDLSYDEMAELTGASVSAMKMRVHRAIDALREHFDKRPL